MVISSASSTCMEAVIRNIPVAIISQLGRITQNPILQTVEKRLWTICYTQRELSDAVSAHNKFVSEGGSSSAHKNFDWSSILSIEPTAESINEFLDIPTSKIISLKMLLVRESKRKNFLIASFNYWWHGLYR